MGIVDKIRYLADEKDTNISEIERKLEFSNGSVRKWDNSSPSVDKIDKVAHHLNVSLDYLLGKTDVRAQYSNALDPDQLTDREEKDLAKIMQKMKDQLIGEQGLMFDGEALDEETIRLLLESIEQQERMVKVINRKYVPKKYRK